MNINIKKFVIGLCVSCMFITTNSQVSINTSSPSSTLDVTGKLGKTDLDGLQAPRLTRAQLTNKTVSYGTPQTGTLIYITDISGGSATGQRVNMTAIGYYYFDGTVWQPVANDVNDGKLTTTLNETPFTFTANQAGNTTITPFYAPTTVGTEGQLLQSNGSGTPTWATTVTCEVNYPIIGVVNNGNTTNFPSIIQTQKQILPSNSSSGYFAEYDFTRVIGTTSITLVLNVQFTGETSKTASKVQGTLIVTDIRSGISTQLITSVRVQASSVTNITFPAVKGALNGPYQINIPSTTVGLTFN